MLIRRWHGRRRLVIAAVLAAISIVCAARILATVVAPGDWGLDRIDQRAGTDEQLHIRRNGQGRQPLRNRHGVLGAHVDFQDRRDHSTAAASRISATSAPPTACRDQTLPRCTPAMMATTATAPTTRASPQATRMASRRTHESSRCGPRAMTSMKDRNAARPGMMRAAVAAAVKWITAHGQRPGVVNISFAFDRATDDLQNAIHASVQAGFVYVLSGKTGGTGHWGNVLPSETMIVGGTRSDDTPIGEGYGSDLALFAPAEGLYGAGRRSVTDVSIPEASGSCPALCAGDSFAAPFVSGVAATYLELHPQASPAAVRSALLSAATTVSTLSKPLLYSRLTLVPKSPA